jgi:hypothetical protein
MPDVDTVRSWQGATLVDRDGDCVGTIDAIYVDDQSGQPESAAWCKSVVPCRSASGVYAGRSWAGVTSLVVAVSRAMEPSDR